MISLDGVQCSAQVGLVLNCSLNTLTLYICWPLHNFSERFSSQLISLLKLLPNYITSFSSLSLSPLILSAAHLSSHWSHQLSFCLLPLPVLVCYSKQQCLASTFSALQDFFPVHPFPVVHFSQNPLWIQLGQDIHSHTFMPDTTAPEKSSGCLLLSCSSRISLRVVLWPADILWWPLKTQLHWGHSPSHWHSNSFPTFPHFSVALLTLDCKLFIVILFLCRAFLCGLLVHDSRGCVNALE